MITKTFTTTIAITLFFNLISYSQNNLNLKNSNLEGVSPEGKFWWWNNVAKNGADATFSIEDFDTNPGSEKALKVKTNRLGEKGWFLSTQYNQKFKAKEDDEILVTFYAKSKPEGGKIKLVIQSDVKGSFQGKDFILSEDWNEYSHKFNLKSTSNKQGIRIWYMTEGIEFYIDDLLISK